MTTIEAMKFRKKPVVIDAVQWTGKNLVDVIRHTGLNASATHFKWDEYEDLVRRDGLKIFTIEGKMNADIDDWIIKGVKGECYPCKPDIFEMTYEREEAQTVEPKMPPLFTNLEWLGDKVRVHVFQRREDKTPKNIHSFTHDIPPLSGDKATGWDNGLSQDYNKGLGTWFADKPGAKQELREQFKSGEREALISWQHDRAKKYTSQGYLELANFAAKTADMLAADAVIADKRVAAIAADREYWREQAQQVAVPLDAGHFYNLVMHAIMDVNAPHDGCKARLEHICEDLVVLINAAPQPPQGVSK